MRKSSEREIYICPIDHKPCSGRTCPLWLELEDWQGCAIDAANQGIKAAKPLIKQYAGLLDRIVNIASRFLK